MQCSPLGAPLVLALLLPTFTGACIHRSSSAPLGARSNIMLIIADDLGNDKIGVYQQGDDLTRPKTPNIDELARRGVRFVNAYATPFCSPTRATLLTGQYGSRHDIGTVIRGRDQIVLPLYPKQLPIPMMLDLGGSGYDHSQVGKWHLASRRSGGPRSPLEHGFNWSAGAPANIRSGCADCDYFSWMKQVNGSVSRVNVYATTDTTNDAIARANEMHEPWFMWLAYNAPHEPFHIPPNELHSQTDLEDDVVRMYAAMVEALDTEIGRLLASIEPSRLENTTIIFMGDNGTPRSAVPPAYATHAAKGSLREAGANVPFIVAGPVVPDSSRGRVSEVLVNSTDVYATLAEIAGVNLGDVVPPGVTMDSISLLAALVHPDRVPGARRYAHTEKFQPNGPGPYTFDNRSVRDRRWKLIRKHNVKKTPQIRDEMYDLSAAPAGADGDDLCPCPENLEAEARAAYERLVRALEELQGT